MRDRIGRYIERHPGVARRPGHRARSHVDRLPIALLGTDTTPSDYPTVIDPAALRSTDVTCVVGGGRHRPRVPMCRTERDERLLATKRNAATTRCAVFDRLREACVPGAPR